jgi:hypothetical protein
MATAGPPNRGPAYRPAFQPEQPAEQSGSLTGHILSQGNQDGPTPKSRTFKVIFVMVLVLAFLIGFGTVAALATGNAITDIFKGLVGGQ